MIELTRETLEITKYYSTNSNYKRITLFGIMSIGFKKELKGERLTWVHPQSRYAKSKYGLQIIHRGRFTWHSLKRTFEKYLNYDNSFLRKALIKESFKNE